MRKLQPVGSAGWPIDSGGIGIVQSEWGGPTCTNRWIWSIRRGPSTSRNIEVRLGEACTIAEVFLVIAMNRWTRLPKPQYFVTVQLGGGDLAVDDLDGDLE